MSKAGVCASSKLHCGSSVLWLAAKNGDTGILSFLIQSGATPTPNRDGQWPVHIAASRGHAGAVRLLLAASMTAPTLSGAEAAALGTNPAANVVNAKGETPMFAACFYHCRIPNSDSQTDILEVLAA